MQHFYTEVAYTGVAYPGGRCFGLQVYHSIISRRSLCRLHGHKGAEGLPRRRKLSAGSPLARHTGTGALLICEEVLHICWATDAVYGHPGQLWNSCSAVGNESQSSVAALLPCLETRSDINGRLVAAAGGTRFRHAGWQLTACKGGCCGAPGLFGAVAEGAGGAAVPPRQAAGQAPRPLRYACGLCPACNPSLLTCAAVMFRMVYRIVCSLAAPDTVSATGWWALCNRRI